MPRKRCSKCKKFCDTRGFSRSNTKKDGLQNYCKECERKSNRRVTPKMELPGMEVEVRAWGKLPKKGNDNDRFLDSFLRDIA